jgi:hypothetical protein
MENKNIKILAVLLVVAFVFYQFVYRPEHIKNVCLIAYPESAPHGGSGLPALPSLPSFEPDYNSCLRSYGLK